MNKCKHKHVVISDSIMLCRFQAHCHDCGRIGAWMKTIKSALKSMKAADPEKEV